MAVCVDNLLAPAVTTTPLGEAGSCVLPAVEPALTPTVEDSTIGTRLAVELEYETVATINVD